MNARHPIQRRRHPLSRSVGPCSRSGLLLLLFDGLPAQRPNPFDPILFPRLCEDPIIKTLRLDAVASKLSIDRDFHELVRCSQSFRLEKNRAKVGFARILPEVDAMLRDSEHMSIFPNRQITWRTAERLFNSMSLHEMKTVFFKYNGTVSEAFFGEGQIGIPVGSESNRGKTKCGHEYFLASAAPKKYVRNATLCIVVGFGWSSLLLLIHKVIIVFKQRVFRVSKKFEVFETHCYYRLGPLFDVALKKGDNSVATFLPRQFDRFLIAHLKRSAFVGQSGPAHCRSLA